MKIVKTLEDAEEYLCNRKMEIFLERLERERGIYRKYNDMSTEICLSDNYSSINKLDDGFFDDNVMSLKDKTLFSLLEKFPKGVVINDNGGMCPIL